MILRLIHLTRRGLLITTPWEAVQGDKFAISLIITLLITFCSQVRRAATSIFESVGPLLGNSCHRNYGMCVVIFLMIAIGFTETINPHDVTSSSHGYSWVPIKYPPTHGQFMGTHNYPSNDLTLLVSTTASSTSISCHDQGVRPRFQSSLHRSLRPYQRAGHLESSTRQTRRRTWQLAWRG